jgi:YidC/Oxa1 family membrane protein insertase
VLNFLYEAVARIILTIHSGLSPVFGAGSGWSWGLSIVLLTMLMRLLLFPLFVKQIKTQRMMQTLQPRMKELQTRHKGDRETLQAETMKLYKEHGANPLAGCLPILLQIPVFIALFHVLNGIKPVKGTNIYHGHDGISASLVESAAHAKIFGAPIASSFHSSTSLLQSLNATPTTVKVVAAIMVALMGATTFWTQRQLMARNTADGNTQFAAQQKILLYVLPFTFVFSGIVYGFPIGVLLYWLTTNVWSMAQQHVVISKMTPVPVVAAAAAPPPTRAARGLPAVAKPAEARGAAAVTPSVSAAATRRPGGSGGKTRRGRSRRGGRR